MSLAIYFTSYVLNMFRTLIYPSVLQASACNTDTTQTQPHQISQHTTNREQKTDVVIQQQIRKRLMMDILMSETC